MLHWPDATLTPSWRHHDAAMTPPWRRHDAAMTPPWRRHDAAMTPPWRRHDAAVTPPWRRRDAAMAPPWRHLTPLWFSTVGYFQFYYNVSESEVRLYNNPFSRRWEKLEFRENDGFYFKPLAIFLYTIMYLNPKSDWITTHFQDGGKNLNFGKVMDFVLNLWLFLYIRQCIWMWSRIRQRSIFKAVGKTWILEKWWILF